MDRILRSLKSAFIRFVGKLGLTHVMRFHSAFFVYVLRGYRVYRRLIAVYGSDTVILQCAHKGTGDYYLCGLYLQQWLEQNGVSNYVFMTPGGSQERVTELFPVYKGHTVNCTDREMEDIRNFRGFIGPKRQRYLHLDHQYVYPLSPGHDIATFNLMGFRGLTMLDFYLAVGFHLPEDTPRSMPVFSNDIEHIKVLFHENGLSEGKTVLLSPYSASNAEYLPDDAFWKQIAKDLADKGYTVCTNCGPGEKPVAGTVPLLIRYSELVPFLELAGGLIAVRSGLCDIASTARCRKVVLHSYKNRFWPDGNSIAYTGLENMGLCRDAVEIEINDVLDKLQKID